MSEIRVALVTGASRGIGLATAQYLANSGFGIVGTATAAPGIQAIEDALGPSNALRAALQLDVTSSASLTHFLPRWMLRLCILRCWSTTPASRVTTCYCG